jgi:hypothetical protein
MILRMFGLTGFQNVVVKELNSSKGWNVNEKIRTDYNSASPFSAEGPFSMKPIDKAIVFDEFEGEKHKLLDGSILKNNVFIYKNKIYDYYPKKY